LLQLGIYVAQSVQLFSLTSLHHSFSFETRPAKMCKLQSIWFISLSVLSCTWHCMLFVKIFSSAIHIPWRQKEGGATLR
jgi:hypothetical protein